MARGRINTVKATPLDKAPRQYTLEAPVMFATIRNEFGEGFLHVGRDHIQVIVSRNGEEVVREVIRRQ